MSKSTHFTFDGGVSTYFGTAILAALLTVFTAGLGFPWALCMKQRWITKHTLIDGRRLIFTAHGGGLILLWIKWMLLIFITLGIYSFWVGPNLQRWIVEHTDFEG
ncbi:MAG: DUF898 family protein [Ignavibacteriae bacterium]|nr:DUF898 family protein [Ignavibacteriota bacterium]